MTDRQTVRQTDRQTVRQTNRQTDRFIERQSELYLPQSEWKRVKEQASQKLNKTKYLHYKCFALNI